MLGTGGFVWGKMMEIGIYLKDNLENCDETWKSFCYEKEKNGKIKIYNK